jgi:hypothetical protein
MSARGVTNKKYNEYFDVDENIMGAYAHNTKTIFYFDKNDYDLIKTYCWSKNSEGYLEARSPFTKKTILLHRLIMNFPEGMVDHKNRDKDNNVRENLRISTNKENLRNGGVRINNKTGFIGVVYKKCLKKWSSNIKVDGHQIYLGLFDNITDAIVARLRAEKEYFGEFSPQIFLFERYGI